MSEVLRPAVLVVGGGPGGYVAAIRAGQLGLETVLVDADGLGGTCLLRGCIPSKALIHAASEYASMMEKLGKGRLGIRLEQPPLLDFAETVRWKDEIVGKLTSGVGALLKRAHVRVIAGRAVFSDAKTCAVETSAGTITIRPEHVILATGSVPVTLPALPFGGDIISSTEALSLAEVPKRLAIIGAGYIGLELGTAFRKLGSAVTVIEATDRILPLMDAELTEPVRKWLVKHDVTLELGALAKGFKNGVLTVARGKDEFTVAADKLLVTVGRRPNLHGWGFETMGVDLAGAFIKVDERCHSSMRNVWAIGDLAGEPLLAHKASAQGEMVAEIIAGHRRRFAPATIPAICFTEPEIVATGLTPGEAARDGVETIVAQFPFSANGRSLGMEGGVGFVRVVARGSDNLILGIQGVGGHISELSGEFVQAIEMGATLEDVAGMIHAHPTLSEAFAEASLRALGHPIHV